MYVHLNFNVCENFGTFYVTNGKYLDDKICEIDTNITLDN